MRNDAEMFGYIDDHPRSLRELVTQELKNAQLALEAAKQSQARMVEQVVEQDEKIRKLDAACMEYSHWLRNNK